MRDAAFLVDAQLSHGVPVTGGGEDRVEPEATPPRCPLRDRADEATPAPSTFRPDFFSTLFPRNRLTPTPSLRRTSSTSRNLWEFDVAKLMLRSIFSFIQPSRIAPSFRSRPPASSRHVPPRDPPHLHIPRGGRRMPSKPPPNAPQ